MIWLRDAFWLCEECLQAGAGTGVTSAARSLQELLGQARLTVNKYAPDDSVSWWLHTLYAALSGARGLASQLGKHTLADRLDDLGYQAHELLQRYTGEGWAAEELEAVLRGGPLEHLADNREQDHA